MVAAGWFGSGMSQVNFNCSQPLTLTGCNHIPNPGFSYTTGVLDPMNNSFNYGYVPSWGGVGCGTADLNGRFTANVPLPVVPAALAGVNYASMLAMEPYPSIPPSNAYEEGISAKIVSVKKGKKYVFSFFMASSLGDGGVVGFSKGAAYILRVVLTKCYNITPANSCNTQPWHPVLTQKQDIFCEPFNDKEAAQPWRQYMVSFTAADDYDMLLIYPEVTGTAVTGDATYVHIGYPELIGVDDLLKIGTPDPTCLTDLSACGVKNASFEWTDPNGKIIGNGSKIAVKVHNDPGNYTVTMSVPAHASANTCSSNITGISKTLYVGECICDGTGFVSAEMLYTYRDYLNFPDTGPYTFNLLENCGVNTICHGTDEGGLDFDIVSDEPNGNVWEIFRDGIPSTDPQAHLSVYNVSWNQQQFNPTVIFILFTAPTTIEIRCTNTQLNRVRSLYITLHPQAVLTMGSCWSNSTPGWIKVKETSVIYTTPATQYIWDLSNAPAGFQYSQASLNSPDLEYYLPPGTPSFDAAVRILGSQYDCDNVYHVTLNSDAPSCSWKVVTPLPDTVKQVNKKVTSAATRLHVFPNPATATLTVMSQQAIDRIDVVSIDGKKVHAEKVRGSRSTMAVSHLQKGTYLLMVTYTDGSSENKLFIKQ